MLLTLVTLSLLGDVAPFPKVPAPPPAQCSADDQCMLSTFQGCCGGCCGGAPHAVRKGTRENERCAVIDCALPDCSAVRCAKPPDPASFVAVCRAGQCVAVQKNEAPAECRSTSECTVATSAPPGASCHQSACGCCPVSRAVPVDAVVPLQKRRDDAPPDKPGKPNFGLSTGGPNAPPAPNCSPCPAPTSGSAVCQAGRCVFIEQPIIRPRPRPPG